VGTRLTAAALHKGVRVAVAATLGFLCGRYLLDDPQTAVYATLTPIALLGLGDVGGPLAARERAYAAALVVAALLAVLGTLVSDDTAAAAVVIGVVTFLVSLAGAGGRNAAGLGRSLILVVVVSAGIPAPDSAIDERLVGVAIGGASVLAAALLLWPEHAGAEYRRRLAAAVAPLAELTRLLAESRPDEHELARLRAAASDALAATRADALAAVERPSGPTSVETAQRLMPPGLRQLEEMLEQVAEAPVGGAGRELLGALAAGLTQAAELLDSGKGRPPDLNALEAARRRFADESDRRLSELIAQERDPEELARTFGQEFRLRRLGAFSAALCGQARVAAGVDRDVWIPGVHWTSRSPLERLIRLVRLHLTPQSVVVRNALRLAVALAVARALAGAFDLEHGFWVVFATLSVLHGTARGTRASAARALLGTAIGAVVATGLMLAFESEATVHVFLIPLFVFIAIAGGSISFVLGQAGFTLMIVTLFNLVAPPAWNTGLIRLEDVALGALVGLAIGAAAWPRGAGGLLRRALGEAMQAGAHYAADVSRALLGTQTAAERLDERRSAAVGAARRAEDVFAAYLAEAMDPGAALKRWSALLERTHRLWYEADLMAQVEPARHQPCPALSTSLNRAVGELEAGYRATADSVISDADAPDVPALLPLSDLGTRSRACARSLAGSNDQGSLLAGVRLFGVRAWIVELGRQLTEMRAAARKAG
jgi:uncharacterized membrane protein YccC